MITDEKKRSFSEERGGGGPLVHLLPPQRQKNWLHLMKGLRRNTQRGEKTSVSPSVNCLLKTNSAMQTLQRLQRYFQSGARLGIHYQRNLMIKCCVIATVPMEPDAHSLFPDLKIVVNKHSYQMNHVKTRVAGYNLLPVAQTSRN